MAATLRCLARTIAGSTRNVELLRSSVAPSNFALIQVRDIHQQATPKIQTFDLNKLPDFEISKDPNEWKYVEYLLRSDNIVPKPNEFENKSPAGWTSPKEKAKELPYFIPRTKNYMQPVYLLRSFRGMRHITIIRKIQGDIWQCEKEIRKFLTKKLANKDHTFLAIRVNEMSCQIRIRGDYVSLIKYWMDQQGF